MSELPPAPMPRINAHSWPTAACRTAPPRFPSHPRYNRTAGRDPLVRWRGWEEKATLPLSDSNMSSWQQGEGTIFNLPVNADRVWSKRDIPDRFPTRSDRKRSHPDAWGLSCFLPAAAISSIWWMRTNSRRDPTHQLDQPESWLGDLAFVEELRHQWHPAFCAIPRLPRRCKLRNAQLGRLARGHLENYV